MAKFPLSMLLFLASVSLVNAACDTSVAAGTTSYCCLSSISRAFSYEIDDNSSWDSYSVKVVQNRDSASHFSSAQCAYDVSSNVCTGACNVGQDCQKALTVQSSDYDKFCLALTCENNVFTCVFDSVTFTGTPVVTTTNCDASSAPTNGGVGTCTSSLARGSSCQPTCNTGYTVSGTTTCSSSGTLTRATCSLTSTPSAGWSLQTGDSLTLSANTCSGGYTTCQALCAQDYSVFKSGATYTLTPTASQASLPSGCSCYTLSATPNANGVATGTVQGISGLVTTTETSATTYSVYIQSGPCTLTYTKVTGSSLGSTSGASHLTHTFTFAALIAGAFTLF